MKWNKAVEKIEQMKQGGEMVCIRYHRKWMKNDAHIEYVHRVIEYGWFGQVCKAVETLDNMLDEGSFIIDEVTA